LPNTTAYPLNHNNYRLYERLHIRLVAFGSFVEFEFAVDVLRVAFVKIAIGVGEVLLEEAFSSPQSAHKIQVSLPFNSTRACVTRAAGTPRCAHQ